MKNSCFSEKNGMLSLCRARKFCQGWPKATAIAARSGLYCELGLVPRGMGMSRSKHTEAAIIAALKQVEAGRKVEDVAREQGVSKHAVYAWKAKYGGMEVSEAEEVKHLRDENARLKKLVADLSLDKDMLQSVIRKNSLGS